LRPNLGVLTLVKLVTSHESTPRPARAGCCLEPARRRIPELNSLGIRKDVNEVFSTEAFMGTLLSDLTDYLKD
jgi:hypothetical protein